MNLIMKLENGTRVDASREFFCGHSLPPIGSTIEIKPWDSTQGITKYKILHYNFVIKEEYRAYYREPVEVTVKDITYGDK